MTTASPWWTPHIHADRRPRLMARNAIAAALRSWFAERDFVEVTTSALQVSPGNEAHLAAFATEAIGPDASRQPLYLHTSPEFACKKLLAAGEERIFSLGPVWRNRERGPLHHPEFTMLEWYRVGESYEILMADCAEFLALAAEKTGAKSFRFRGREADPFAEPERLSVAEAFARHAGIDLLATVSVDGSTDRDALHGALVAAGLRTAPDDTWADLFSRVMVEKIEPALGQGRATILYGYPVSEAALARPSAVDPRVSSSIAAASSSPTPSASSPTRPSSAAASSPRWTRRSASMASVIRWTRISWRHWQSCRRQAARPSASTGW